MKRLSLFNAAGRQIFKLKVANNEIFASLLALPLLLFSCQPKIDYPAAESYIRQCENDWAEAAVTGDTTVLNRILADDFLGVDPDGSQYTKQDMITAVTAGPRGYVSNRLNEVKLRFFGNTAVAQGSETWTRVRLQTGDTIRGRFVWTDTWWLRDGKWQIVAAEDLIAPVE